ANAPGDRRGLQLHTRYLNNRSTYSILSSCIESLASWGSPNPARRSSVRAERAKDGCRSLWSAPHHSEGLENMAKTLRYGHWPALTLRNAQDFQVTLHARKNGG